jgi:uncharacterized membrane protein
MLPEPLHPAVVHFPVVLAFLLPLAAVIAIWTIRRGSPAKRAWLVPLLLGAALASSTWISSQTGEAEEEKVERVVSEELIGTHEEAAEALLIGSGVILLVAAAGLVQGRIGTAARILTAVGSLGLVAGVAWVGHTGGELVYRHGAASAYTVDAVTSQRGTD